MDRRASFLRSNLPAPLANPPFANKTTPAMDFEQKVAAPNLDLVPRTVETMQVNLGKLCNQA